MADITPVTWSVLLAKWTEFAQASLALPETAEGERWRSAVPAIIALQAVTMALNDLDELEDDERRLGLDRAEVLVSKHASELNALWRSEELPEDVVDVIDDARLSLIGAKANGYEWTVASQSLVTDHPADLVATLLTWGFAGDLFIPSPGVPLFKGCPAAFLRGPLGTPVDDDTGEAVEDYLERGGGRLSDPERTPFMRQAYRQFDFSKGGPVRDLVVPFERSLPAGQPLLIPAILSGQAAPVPLPPRGKPNLTPLPVVHEDPEREDQESPEQPPPAG